MVSHCVFGQEVTPTEKKLSVGIYTGLTLCLFNQDIGWGNIPDFKRTPRTGFNLGVRLRYPLNKSIYLRLDPMMTGRGGAYRTVAEDVVVISNDPSYTKEYYYKNYRLTYLELPVMVDFDLSGQKKLFLGFGPSVAVLTGSSFRSNEFVPKGRVNSQGQVELKNTYSTEDLDAGKSSISNFIVEFSADLNSAVKYPMFLSLRYTGSLQEVFDDAKTGGENTKMTTWSFNMGFRLK